MASSLKSKTIYGMIWVGIQRFGSVLISFISNIVLARLLTPDDYGYIGMLMIFIAVANTFIDGGFGSALIQKTSPTQRDYSTVFYWNLFLSICFYSVLYLCAPLIADFYNMPLLASILRLQGVVIIINASTIVQFNILRKQMQFKKIAIVQVIAACVSVIVAIVYAWHGGGVWSLVWQQIVMGITNMVLLIIVKPWCPSMVFSLESFKELFGFGSFILLSSLTNTIANNLNGLIVGKFFSASTLGYLTQSKKIEDVSSSSIAAAVEQVTYPLLVEVKNDYQRMAQILRMFNIGLLSIIMPLMYLIIIEAEPLIVLLFKEKWLPSAPILQILCFQGIFNCLQGSSYNVVAAIGKSHSIFNWTLIKRISGIIIWIIGMLLYGFKGLLIGMIISSMGIWLCNGWLVSKFIGYKLRKQIYDLLPIVLVATIPFITCLIALEFQLVGSNRLIYGLFFVLTYVLILFCTPHKQIIELRSNILSIIKRNK